MHMQGNPRSMQKEPRYTSLIDEIIAYLADAIERGTRAGIEREKIIIDPGIGFGKTLEHNLEILNRLSDFKVLGRPILVGPSRKSFIESGLSMNNLNVRSSVSIASAFIFLASTATCTSASCNTFNYWFFM